MLKSSIFSWQQWLMLLVAILLLVFDFDPVGDFIDSILNQLSWRLP
jgi:hypothetical protein